MCSNEFYLHFLLNNITLTAATSFWLVELIVNAPDLLLHVDVYLFKMLHFSYEHTQRFCFLLEALEITQSVDKQT